MQINVAKNSVDGMPIFFHMLLPTSCASKWYQWLRIYLKHPFCRRECEHIMKTHVRGFFDTDLHEVSWHFATHEAVRPSGF